jgi:A/G-specific adenine glycosylase
LSDFSKEAKRGLLDWYDRQRRALPWRQTSDPYAIWVSEVMLQQTQVATVERYWRRWMDRFPTVEALADSTEQEVLAEWQGLGYYRRCRMLREGAKTLKGSPTPATVREWTRVPGIGRYTAGAIASIAQGEKAAVVDGNVERVYARLTADSSEGAKLNRQAWDWAEAHVDQDRPGDWNQALMELGATVCLPGTPRCGECPVSHVCEALRRGETSNLPAKAAKPKIVQLSHEIWIPWDGSAFGVRQVPAGRWWHGMWEFPREDADHLEKLHQAVGTCDLKEIGRFRHTVTNHRIQVAVRLALVSHRTEMLAWHTLEELQDLPMSSPQRKALGMVLKHLRDS